MRNCRRRSGLYHCYCYGEGEDTDSEDRQHDGAAGDVLEAAEGPLQEGGGALHPLRRRGRPHRLLLHRQALPVLQLQMEDSKYASLSKQVAETGLQLRQMRGEDLEGLSVEELQLLEKKLEAGLHRVLDKKDAKIMEQITDLRKKGLDLVEENSRLRHQMLQTSGVGINQSENALAEDGLSSESVMTATQSGGSLDYDDSSDTSLKLGLPYCSWK